MKVLLLTSSYAPVLGGVQTVTQALARNLLARGHDVRVVTNRYPRRLPAYEILDGVSVQRWQFLPPTWTYLRQCRLDLLLASLYYGPSVRRRLGRFLESFQPDVVNVHFPDAQIPFLIGLKRRFGFRLVVSLHGHEVERFTSTNDVHSASHRLAILMRQADAVTACSRHLLERACWIEPSVQAKGVVLYNGLDLGRFQDARAYTHPRPYILGLGRLTRKKGFDLLLEALARLNPFATDVDLILAGEGEERPALEEQARALGLEKRVYFHGRASQEEVVQLLKGCLFLVIPSREEPFGIVALEGLAAGKPILATRVGGMGEFLQEITTSSQSAEQEGEKLQPVQDRVRLVGATVEEISEGIRAFLVSGTLCLQKVNRPTIIQEYSWEQVSRRYERVLAPK